jgi:methionyl-tRNA synthetase
LIGDVPPSEHDIAGIQEATTNCQFDRALDQIWEQIRGLNQYIDEEKPWAIAKSGDADYLREVLAYQASCLLEIAELLVPFLPGTAAKIKAIFTEGVIKPIEGTLFPKQEQPAKAA